MLDVLNESSIQTNVKKDTSLSEKIAEMGAVACWGLNEWDQMKSYVEYLPESTFEGSLYRSVLEIIQNDDNGNMENTIKFIEKARDLLDNNLTSTVFQSYERSYQTIIDAQVLVELEEMMTFKREPLKRSFLVEKWWARLNGCERSVEYWHRLLLVAPREKGFKYRLKCSSICEKWGYFDLSHQILSLVLDEIVNLNDGKNLSSTSRDFELCQYAYMKYLITSGNKNEAFNSGENFVEFNLHPKLIKCQNIYSRYSVSNSPRTINLDELYKRMMDISIRSSKCYLKLGQINQELNDFNDTFSVNKIIDYFKLAKDHNQESYKAWYEWASMNYRALEWHKKRENTSFPLESYVECSILGFFKCLQLNFLQDKSNLLKDTLRLLTIWFNYCNSKDIYELICQNIKSISNHVWLSVIPQLIARIDTQNAYLSELIYNLLSYISIDHPQALIYRLILASNSNQNNKKSEKSNSNLASKLLNLMKQHYDVLVNQAKIVQNFL